MADQLSEKTELNSNLFLHRAVVKFKQVNNAWRALAYCLPPNKNAVKFIAFQPKEQEILTWATGL